MATPVRRVVTGHTSGKSVFIMDGPAPTVMSRGTASTEVTELWETRGAPASNEGDDDPTRHPYRLPPPKNGTVFRVIEYPPDKIRVAALRDPQQTSHDAGREGFRRDLGNARHPGFHKTDTIDYAIVLKGEIWALMDEGEVLLKAGDVLIQRGTSHAWSVRTDESATVAFVLIDAAPI